MALSKPSALRAKSARLEYLLQTSGSASPTTRGHSCLPPNRFGEAVPWVAGKRVGTEPENNRNECGSGWQANATELARSGYEGVSDRPLYPPKPPGQSGHLGSAPSAKPRADLPPPGLPQNRQFRPERSAKYPNCPG